MTTYSNVRVYGFGIVLLFLSVVISSQSSGKRPRHPVKEQESVIKPIERVEDLKTVNKTSAFNIARIKKISDDLFEITYKNEYSKRITGFEVSIGGMRVQTELILGGDEEQFIPPGSTYQKTYSAQSGLDRYGVQILAVVFDDGSSDGEVTYIKEITDYRLGMNTERKRVLRLLEQIITSNSQNMSVELEELESHISSTIPSNQQNTKLDNVGLGMRNERRRMLDEIRILKDKQQNPQRDERKALQLKEDLIIVKEMYENIIRLASVPLKPRRSSQ